MSQKDKTFGLSSENHVQLRKLNKEFLLARNVCFDSISGFSSAEILINKI